MLAGCRNRETFLSGSASLFINHQWLVKLITDQTKYFITLLKLVLGDFLSVGYVYFHKYLIVFHYITKIK